MVNFIHEIREWIMLAMEAGILYYVAREFYYDRDKDLAKEHKKTRTTKKVTNKPGGETITEESIETSESSFKGEMDATDSVMIKDFDKEKNQKIL